MGICNSTTQNKTQSKKSKVTQYQLNPPTSSIKANSNYILSESIAKRTDLTNDYILSEKILGEGSSGIVCLGTAPSGINYAIKRINKSDKKINHLMKEAEFLLNLSHEHIIKCHAIYEDLKMISFIIELAEGGDLFDFISKASIGEIPHEATIDIMIQILETLDYLHTVKGIVHRDVKPENIMVCINNGIPTIKLIDFGFATYINYEKGLNDYVGTPQFVAPEIIAKLRYNEKVDVWSAGVILYNMLTGYEPFYSEYKSKLDEQILYKDIKFDKIENIELRALCKGMLTRDSGKRLSALEALNIARIIRNNISNPQQEKEEKELVSVNTRAMTFESICERYQMDTNMVNQLQYVFRESKIKDFLSFEAFYQIQFFKSHMTLLN